MRPLRRHLALTSRLFVDPPRASRPLSIQSSIQTLNNVDAQRPRLQMAKLPFGIHRLTRVCAFSALWFVCEAATLIALHPSPHLTNLTVSPL